MTRPDDYQAIGSGKIAIKAFQMGSQQAFSYENPKRTQDAIQMITVTKPSCYNVDNQMGLDNHILKIIQGDMHVQVAVSDGIFQNQHL